MPVERDTPARPYCWGGKGYNLHVCTSWVEKEYILHIHTAEKYLRIHNTVSKTSVGKI
jgi:hypothetical protein